MPDSDASLPQGIAELAEACRQFVKEALGLPLDYTPDTLPLLDHYVRTKAETPTQEVRDLLTPPLGAYFGEVVRRSFDGVRWHAPDDDYASYRLEFDAFFLHFNPLGVAAAVVMQSAADGFGAHFQVLDEARPSVESALSNQMVREQDYYTFSVRFETLELVTSVLLGLEARHEDQPRHFSHEVYRAASGEFGKGSVS